MCRPAQVERYVNRVSGPLLDRIDLHVEVPALAGERLTDVRRGEPSAVVAARVLAARERQHGRTPDGPTCNADLAPRQLRVYCRIDAASEKLLRMAVTRLGLSARAYHRVLRVARTISDLAGSGSIQAAHVAEAIQYRAFDRTSPAR